MYGRISLGGSEILYRVLADHYILRGLSLLLEKRFTARNPGIRCKIQSLQILKHLDDTTKCLKHTQQI